MRVRKRSRTSDLVVFRRETTSASPGCQLCSRESKLRWEHSSSERRERRSLAGMDGLTLAKLVEFIMDPPPEPLRLLSQVLWALLLLRDQTLLVLLEIILAHLLNVTLEPLQERLDARLDVHRILLRLHQDPVVQGSWLILHRGKDDVAQLLFGSEAVEDWFGSDLS